MCIIRNKPNEGIYCIIWFKLLFGQLFEKPDKECPWMRRLFSRWLWKIVPVIGL